MSSLLFSYDLVHLANNAYHGYQCILVSGWFLLGIAGFYLLFSHVH